MWKDIKGYEGKYIISNCGKVKSIISGRVLVQTKERYKRVTLCFNGKKTNKTVHRIVAEHFVENPDKKPQVNHIDGNAWNNRSSNLEWCTQSENMLHAYQIGLQKPSEYQKRRASEANLGESHHHSKIKDSDVLEIRKLYESGYTQQKIADMFPISRGNVSDIVNLKTWKHI